MQNHRIPYTTATWGIVEDASEPAPCLSVVASRNGKWTLNFALFERRILQKAHKNQNHKILYSTATWDSVEDASEPAPFLSVVANRNGKWTRIFALFERRILQKAHTNQNHRIQYSTATWDSVEVALERAPFQRVVTKRALRL